MFKIIPRARIVGKIQSFNHTQANGSIIKYRHAHRNYCLFLFNAYKMLTDVTPRQSALMWKQPKEIEIMFPPTVAWNWGKYALPEETCTLTQ